MNRASVGHARRVALHVVLPLGLGVLAYAAWRSHDVRIVGWMSRVAPRGVDVVRGAGASQIPALVAGSLPDAAWAWAFGAALALVWHGKDWRERRGWLLAGWVAALATELGQAVSVVPGTFDVADLVAIGLGYVLGASLATRRSPHREQLGDPRKGRAWSLR
jgi:hypothetical protein